MTLADKTCSASLPGSQPLAAELAIGLLKEAPGWAIDADGRGLWREFTFTSYWEGVGFVNAVAWIAQNQHHHPEIELDYKKVGLRFSTHTAGGLTENDFICAAKVNGLQA